MKFITATSDLHGRLNGLDKFLKDIDICIIAGDFAELNGRSSIDIKDQVCWINTVFVKFLNKFSNVQFVIVPGNHDLCMDENKVRKMLSNGTDMSIKWPSNAHVLIDSSCDIDGVKIYGTPWVPAINGTWAFELDNINLKKKFSKIPENIDILVSHAPPRIEDSLLDCSYDGEGPFGSIELT